MLPFLLVVLVVSAASQVINTHIQIKYPKFDGTSYIRMQPLRNSQRTFNFSLTFRPESHEGILLFSAKTVEAATDFFAVVLKDGFVVFRFDCGSGLAELRSTYRVNLNAWNKLVISRVGRRGKLQLNNEQPVEGLSQGDQEEITFTLNLYVGGYYIVSSAYGRIGTTHFFVGCVKELLIESKKVDFRYQELQALNGLNIESCDFCLLCENGGTCKARSADETVCLCPLGFYGDICTESQTVHAPQFSGNSYLEFPGLLQAVTNLTYITIFFKPYNRNGLLIYEGLDRRTHGDFVSLSLRNGILEFKFDLGSGPAVLKSVQPLTVGSWHTVRASRTDRMGTLNIDDQAPVTGHSQGDSNELTLSGKLYLGGHPNFYQTARRAKVRQSFSGCVQQVIINNRSLDLMGDASSGYDIRPCSDLCDGRPCLNEELYRRLLYQISGKFVNGNIYWFKSRGSYSLGPYSYNLTVTPINTTLFPNKETFFVSHVYNGKNIGKFLMTLQYIKERLVQVERYYFLPDVKIPGEITGSTFFNTLTWSSFNTTSNNCGGSIYLINSSNVETVGTLNNCDNNIRNPAEYNININCSNIIAAEDSAGNYTEHIFRLAERLEFPTGWSFNPC